MPNWCMNTIEITGPPANLVEIRQILKTFDNKSHIFAGLIGDKIVDVATSSNPLDDGLPVWYQNNLHNFRTKWDVSFENCNIQYNENSIILDFNTAWSPPANFCKILRDKLKVNVTCVYSEPGCDFAGKLNYYADASEDCVEYRYMEGRYHLNQSSFWNEFESRVEDYVSYYSTGDCSDSDCQDRSDESDKSDESDESHHTNPSKPSDPSKADNNQNLSSEKFAKFMESYPFIKTITEIDKANQIWNRNYED